jgi:tetratricopeptide (TPR) repeat protein
MRASELLQRVIEHNRQGRHQAVLRPLEMLLEKKPDHPRCLWEYAQALHGVGELDAALRQLDALHHAAPRARKAWLFHAQLLKDTDQRLALVERALGHLPGDPSLSRLRADARRMLRSQTSAAAEPPAFEQTELLYDEPIRPEPSNSTPSSQDPEQLAEALAREISAMQDVTDPDYRPLDASRMHWAARQHARRCEAALQPHGFIRLGDFTPRHLEGSLGGSVLMRFFLARDGLTIATCYFLPGSAGSILQQALRWLLRRPNGTAVIELQSELDSGQFVISNNAGRLDAFDYGPDIVREALSPKASLQQLLSSHQTRLLQLGREHAPAKPRVFNDLVDIVASESRLQAHKAKYRRQIGLATDQELQRLLGKQYAQLGQQVRQQLQRMAATAQ